MTPRCVAPDAVPGPTPGPVTRDGARRAAEQELTKPRYHRDDPTQVQRIAHAVDHVVGRLVGDALAAAPGGALGLVVIGLLVVALVVVVRVRLGALPVRDLFTDRGPGAADRTAGDYRAEADRHAAAGQWEEAVRARTRAVVRALEERGIVDAPPGRTLRAITRQVERAAPTLAADVGRVVQVFGDIWYGGRPATPEDDAAVRDADARMARNHPRAHPRRPAARTDVPAAPR